MSGGIHFCAVHTTTFLFLLSGCWTMETVPRAPTASASSKALVSRDASKKFTYLPSDIYSSWVTTPSPSSCFHPSVSTRTGRDKDLPIFTHILERSLYIYVNLKKEQSKYDCASDTAGASDMSVLCFHVCFSILCNSQCSPTPTKAICSIWDYATCPLVTFPLLTGYK